MIGRQKIFSDPSKLCPAGRVPVTCGQLGAAVVRESFMPRYQHPVIAVSLTTLLLVSCAQSGGNQVSSARDPGLQDIVVTAQKRSDGPAPQETEFNASPRIRAEAPAAPPQAIASM